MTGPDAVFRLLRPVLRAGRWTILLALTLALLLGRRYLDEPGVRPGIALALALYALASTALLRTPSLSSPGYPGAAWVIAGIMGADLAFTALLVEASGGARSPFFGLYHLVIIASAFFYGLTGGLAAAGAVLVITVLGEWRGLHAPAPASAETILAAVLPLSLAAVITGYLTAQLKHEAELRRASERETLVLDTQRESREREMAGAREVQQAALPGTPPRVEGLTVAVRFRSASEVGGDFYDFYQQGGELGLLAGDVGGKGMPAALTATTAMHLFHTLAPRLGLAPWCELFNQEMEGRTPDSMLATAFCCRLDGASGRGAYVNAGHPPPVLCRSGHAPALLEEHGLAFGILPGTCYAEQYLALGPGDLLVIYSDGLTEAVYPDGSLTGIEPLLALMPELEGLTAEETVARIEAHWDEIAELRDDLTLVLVRRG